METNKLSKEAKATIKKIAKLVLTIFVNALANNEFLIKIFGSLGRPSFVGLKNYTNKNGEISNHVIIANFSYANAVKNDLKALQSATLNDVETIANTFGFSLDLVNQAIGKLRDRFIKDQNPDKSKHSKASIGQLDAYTKIVDGLKFCHATGEVYIYALSHSKEVLVKGEYKTVNSSDLTLCQNAVKKYFEFSTTRFRNFIVNPNQLCGVNVNGEKIVLK